MNCFARVVILAGIFAAASGVTAGEYNGPFPNRPASPQDTPVARIIIGLRPGEATARNEAPNGNRVQALSARINLRFRADREISPTMRAVDLEAPVSGTDLSDTLARIAADPDVAFAEPDQRVYRHAVPNDTLFPNQWYLQGQEVAALNAVSAWDTTQGSAGVVVAVLDTGVRFDHPDLLTVGQGGRLLPGFDFVSPDPGGGFLVANDGDGWDADASDPGDWVTTNESQTTLFSGCFPEDSSWHGTRVAGLIGAITNNNAGIAGVTWAPMILPVRVLGKCFGNDSDILQGMRWAGGLHVAGVPDNAFPATVINMSLGAAGACTASYKSVLSELSATGVLVVASAGNSDGPVELPGNCPGVAAVAGLRHIGTKVGYSSFGSQVALAAPGGNCVNVSAPCLFSLDTTSNTGTTTPESSSYTDQFNFNVGTSFSAPFVTAIAALMKSVNGNLQAPYLLARLKEGTRPFPPKPQDLPLCKAGVGSGQFGCACTTTTCGAGIASAPESVVAALRPIAIIAEPAGVAAGQNVVLDASGSEPADGRTVTTYSWTAVCGDPAIVGAAMAAATVVAPSSGSFTVRLTVTDDQAAQDSADITVKSSSAVVAAPETNIACATGGGGGGGAWSLVEMLTLGAGLAVGRRRNRGLRPSHSKSPRLSSPR